MPHIAYPERKGRAASAAVVAHPAAQRFSVPALRPRSLEPVRTRLFALLFALDFIAIAGAYLAANAVWLGTTTQHGLIMSSIVLPVFFAVSLHNRSYSTRALEQPSFGIASALKALLYAAAITVALSFSFKVSDQFSRVVAVSGTLVAAGSIFVLRSIAGQILGRRHHWTFHNRLVVVDGVDVVPNHGDTILSAAQLGLTAGTDDPKERQRLGEMMGRFDAVVLACKPDDRRQWIHSLSGLSVDVEVAMPELSRLGAIALRERHGVKSLVVSGRPLGLVDRALKRALDIVVAGLGLLFVAPVMIACAIAVRLESRGPIFFRQHRVGQNNQPFEVLKFRSMYADQCDATASRLTSVNDNRVTRVGRFLRSSSMDELPQLLNVLMGQMSIVGPRPHAIGATAGDLLYWEADRRYFQRHAIKPGITGLAQVRGFRGTTSQRVHLTDRVSADLEYVTGWTIWRDIRIIVGTFLILVHPNAY